jgi:hypothetical protein
MRYATLLIGSLGHRGVAVSVSLYKEISQMGTARIEVSRMASKHSTFPGFIDRRDPNPLEIISHTSTTTASQSDAVTVQAMYQHLYARVKVDEAARVGVGSGSTDSGGGFELGAGEWSPWLPVQGGDVVEVIDLA